MMHHDLALDALRVSAILAASLLVARLVPGRAAAVRRLVRATAFGCALLLPIATRLAPTVPVPAAPLPEIVVRPFAEPSSSAPASTTTSAVWNGSDGSAVSIKLPPAGDVLFAAWALVAAALGLRVARGYAKARGIVQRADRTLDPAFRGLVSELSELRPFALRLTGELDTPAVAGIFAPVVLMPRSSLAWSEGRKRAALTHELAHLDARDGLAQLAASVVCALHWFNPLVWISSRALRLDQELAADRAALAAGAIASRYASDLLEIARGARRPPSASLGMASPSELERRIRAVIAAPASELAPSRAIARVAVAALLGSTMVIACARPATLDSSSESANASSAASALSSATTRSSGADTRLQAIVDEEITRLVADTKATRAAIIALDPATGRVLAEAGRDHGSPADVAFGATFVPGSTFKVVALAAALDAGTVARDARFDCAPRAYGDRQLHDSSAHGALSLDQIVSASSNVGVSRIFDALGGDRFVASARRFHFGEAPPGIANAASGWLPAKLETGSFEGGAVAAGEGASLASPAQIAAAYATIAAGGVYHAPSRGGSAAGERVVSVEAARTTLELLDGAVNAAGATGSAARVEGVRIAGKTGTSEFTRDGAPHVYASFVGIAPREAPRFVILVSADITDARGDQVSGGTVAAPVFSRIIRRAFTP